MTEPAAGPGPRPGAAAGSPDPAPLEPAAARDATADRPGDAEPGSVSGPDDARPGSGLKNPAGAVRGVAMAALVLESLVVLLAVQPIRMVAPDTPGWGLGVVALVALACLVAAGLLRRRGGWWVGTAVQGAVIATGLLQPAMFVLGAVFLAVWLYVLHLRRTVAGGGAPPAGGSATPARR